MGLLFQIITRFIAQQVIRAFTHQLGMTLSAGLYGLLFIELARYYNIVYWRVVQTRQIPSQRILEPLCVLNTRPMTSLTRDP